MLRSTLVALFAALAIPLPASAGPTPLTSTVTRVPLDPPAVIVPVSAGKTPLARYRSGAKPSSGTPLVLIVRLSELNSPDVVAVTTAQRDGTKIVVRLETRRYQGPLAGNVVTTPLVEIALGTPPRGTYDIDLEEQILSFSKVGAPDTATKPRPGLRSAITLTVQ